MGAIRLSRYEKTKLHPGAKLSGNLGCYFLLLSFAPQTNLWAAILAHGFYNSIGVIVFYFTGPIYGLW